MMSYIQSKRELAKKHQAPSEETLREFKEIVIKSEEEDDVQSGLQEFTQINLHRTDRSRCPPQAVEASPKAA
ncbi:hypothetical protein AMECASPLE_035235 [Ameca splendens]|uniref:Uncharacterized protein n=1 Tax=Ameca splendens TaxID=208324 RepID=A0ABV0XWB4_9TELE